MVTLLLVEGSSFVYGFTTFVDVITIGSTVMLLQYYMPDIPEDPTIKVDYFRWVLSSCCGKTSIFGLIMIAILGPMKIGQR